MTVKKIRKQIKRALKIEKAGRDNALKHAKHCLKCRALQDIQNAVHEADCAEAAIIAMESLLHFIKTGEER